MATHTWACIVCQTLHVVSRSSASNNVRAFIDPCIFLVALIGILTTNLGVVLIHIISYEKRILACQMNLSNVLVKQQKLLSTNMCQMSCKLANAQGNSKCRFTWDIK
jgi:hypothetical protein